MPVTTLILDAEDWARCRFAWSPLWEVVQAVRTLAFTRKQVLHAGWLRRLDVSAARADLPVLTALHPTVGWVPDFLVPFPTPGERTVEQELALVLAHPPGDVATELRRSLDSHPSRVRRTVLEPLIADPTLAVQRLGDELQRAWSRLVAPYWRQVRELLDADVTYRSATMARLGLGQVLAELHPDVSLRGGAVLVTGKDEETIAVAGRGLTLMPSAFEWPSTSIVHEAPWTPTLVYPARGIGVLWSAPPPAARGLEGVLGRTRALLLTDLTTPATTTALAQRHGLSAAAVSTQLSRLRDAGLVTAHRSGKEVRYRRTAAADVLLTSAGG